MTFLTHLGLESHNRDIGKQWRPGSDTAFCCIQSQSALFAIITGNSVKHSDNKKNYKTDTMLLEIDQSKELWYESLLKVNGLR